MLSTYEDFPYKKEIFETLKQMPQFYAENEILSMTALGMRLFIAETQGVKYPLGFDDKVLEETYLSYLA